MFGRFILISFLPQLCLAFSLGGIKVCYKRFMLFCSLLQRSHGNFAGV